MNKKKKCKTNPMKEYILLNKSELFLKSYRLFSLLKTYSLIPGLKDNIK